METRKLLPKVTQEVILAYVDPASRPFDLVTSSTNRINELKTDQPDLAQFLSQAIKVSEANFGTPAAASAAELACMIYILLKRQDISDEAEAEEQAFDDDPRSDDGTHL